MATSAQKSASTSQVNLQNIHQSGALKVLMSDVFTDKQEKLQTFLTKLKLYIRFNHKKFRFKMNKKLYTVSLLKNAAFN